MRLVHKLLSVAPLLLAFSLSGARAAEVHQGQGIACDTQAQVEKYVQIADQADALHQVNAEKPTACAILNIMFIEGAEVSRVSNAQGFYRVINVLVIGVVLPQGVRQVPPLEQYILVRIPTQEA